jgi:predicted amidophosphoribosyltransferase
MAGIALDFHTTSSVPIGENEFGHMQFDTVRPEIAELLFRLKYRNDQAAVAGIVAGAVEFLSPYIDKFDLIIPVPPSSQRAIQPVVVLAHGIGQTLGKPVANCVTTTRSTTQLKGVTDPDERQKLVAGLYAVDPNQTRGRNILLFDDLYRSGTTMNAITDVLLAMGQAATVRVLTVTKTRSTR